MSKTTEIAKSKSSTAKIKPRAEVGPAMFGRDIFVEPLEREGVDKFADAFDQMIDEIGSQLQTAAA